MSIKKLLTCIVMVASFFWGGLDPFVSQQFRRVIEETVNTTNHIPKKDQQKDEEKLEIQSKLGLENSKFYPLFVEIGKLLGSWHSTESVRSDTIRVLGINVYCNKWVKGYLLTYQRILSEEKFQEFLGRLKDFGFNSSIVEHIIRFKPDFNKKQKLPSDLKNDFFLVSNRHHYPLSIHPFLLIYAFATTLDKDLGDFADQLLAETDNPFLAPLKKKLGIPNVAEEPVAEPVAVVVPQEVSKSRAEEVDQSIKKEIKKEIDKQKPSQKPTAEPSSGAASSSSTAWSANVGLSDPAKSDSGRPSLLVRGEKPGESRQIPITSGALPKQSSREQPKKPDMPMTPGVFPEATRQPKKAPILERLLWEILMEEKNRPKPNQPNNIPEQRLEQNEPDREMFEGNGANEYPGASSSTSVDPFDRNDFFDPFLPEVKEDLGYKSEEEWPEYTTDEKDPLFDALLSEAKDLYQQGFTEECQMQTSTTSAAASAQTSIPMYPVNPFLQPPVAMGRWESSWQQQQQIPQVFTQAPPPPNPYVVYYAPLAQNFVPQLYPFLCPAPFIPPQQNYQGYRL